MAADPIQALFDPVFVIFGAMFFHFVKSYYAMPPEVIPEEWLQNIRLTCPKLKSDIESPRLKTFKKMLYSAIFFGVYLGCLIDAHHGGPHFSDSVKNLYTSLFRSPELAISRKAKAFAKWLFGIIVASLCTLIILKSDELTDRILGPILFINAVLMPVLANIFMFGCTRQLVAQLGDGSSEHGGRKDKKE